MSNSSRCLFKKSFFTTSTKACLKKSLRSKLCALADFELRSTFAMASQASRSISNECVFCLRQDWSYTCDAITDSEAGESYLKNHKICFNSLRVVYLSNKSLKTKGCCYCKGIYNL